MANQSSDNITRIEQGLKRLTKEDLVTIASHWHDMSVETVKELAQHIPEFFNLCSDGLQGVFSTHKDAEERSERDNQRRFDELESLRISYEKCFNEATTSEERDKWAEKLEEVDGKFEDLRKTIEKERQDRLKKHMQVVTAIIGVATVGIGGYVRFGKRK